MYIYIYIYKRLYTHIHTHIYERLLITSDVEYLHSDPHHSQPSSLPSTTPTLHSTINHPNPPLHHRPPNPPLNHTPPHHHTRTRALTLHSTIIRPPPQVEPSRAWAVVVVVQHLRLPLPPASTVTCGCTRAVRTGWTR